MSKPQQLSEKYTKEIFQEIKSGIYSRADRLPSEPDIAKHFGISRTMVRDCLSTLEREGFISRKHGIGTIINQHVLDVKVQFGSGRGISGYDSLRWLYTWCGICP